MKRTTFLVALLLGLLACETSPERALVIKASSSSAANEPSVRALEVFGEEVRARSNGRLRVEVYPNNALGNEREVIELAIIGAVELTCPSNAPLATFAPELLVFDLPYLFRDRAHMYAVLDGPIGNSFAEPLVRRGLRLLGYFEAGLRHLMTRRPLERLDGLAGLKIRTMENPLHLAAFRAFGASPLPMAYGEVYTAIEQGVIDGAEASPANYYAKRFFEVAPHWTEIGWMYLVSPLVMSERFYATLAPEDQEVIRAAATQASAWEREDYQRQEREATARLEAAGIRIQRPDTSVLRKTARRMWEVSGSQVDLHQVETIVHTR